LSFNVGATRPAIINAQMIAKIIVRAMTHPESIMSDSDIAVNSDADNN
jgi:hypothetical protein